MKNWLVLICCFLAWHTQAQETDQPAALTYKTYSSIPAFPLLTLDSSRISSISVVQKNEPLIIMYFSPTCGHCQHQAEEITGHIKELKKMKILMVSAYPLNEIRQFNNDYGLAHFANITLAYDPDFSMGRFYELNSLPGIFVYDKSGKLRKAFDTNTTAAEIVKALAN